MGNERFLGGLFLVAFGLVLSLQKFGVIPAFSLWSLVGQLWPLVLILVGLILILTRTSAIKAVIISLFVILLSGVLLAWFGGPDWLWQGLGKVRREVVIPPQTQILDIPWEDGIESLDCKVRLSAGKLEIGSGTQKIAAGELPYYTVPPEVEYNLRQGRGRLSLERGDVPSSMAWQIELTDRVPLSLDIDSGAASLHLDLAPLQAERVTVDMGASDLWLRLGTRVPRAEVFIDAGASRLVLVVPAEAGVRIEVESPLSQILLPDYIRQGDHLYLSPNFEDAAKTIDIRISAGVSFLEVREEGGAWDPSLEGESL